MAAPTRNSVIGTSMGGRDRRQGHRRAEGRDGDGDGDLEVTPGRVEGHGHPILVAEVQARADEEDDEEHGREEDGHGDGHLDDDAGALEDEVTLEGNISRSAVEQEAQDRHRVETWLEPLHGRLPAAPHHQHAGQHPGHQGQAEVEQDALADHEDVEVDVADEQARIEPG